MSNQSQDYSLNNPMVRLAQLYKAVEERLRRCNLPGAHPISMADLGEDQKVKEFANNHQQLRDLVGRLVRANYITSFGPKAAMRYTWNPDAEPFTLQTKTAQRAQKAPSKPKVSKPVEVNHTSNAKEIELVFDGVVVVVGKNPETGRIRITIDG